MKRIRRPSTVRAGPAPGARPPGPGPTGRWPPGSRGMAAGGLSTPARGRAGAAVSAACSGDRPPPPWSGSAVGTCGWGSLTRNRGGGPGSGRGLWRGGRARRAGARPRRPARRARRARAGDRRGRGRRGRRRRRRRPRRRRRQLRGGQGRGQRHRRQLLHLGGGHQVELLLGLGGDPRGRLELGQRQDVLAVQRSVRPPARSGRPRAGPGSGPAWRGRARRPAGCPRRGPEPAPWPTGGGDARCVRAPRHPQRGAAGRRAGRRRRPPGGRRGRTHGAASILSSARETCRLGAAVAGHLLGPGLRRAAEDEAMLGAGAAHARESGRAGATASGGLGEGRLDQAVLAGVVGDDDAASTAPTGARPPTAAPPRARRSRR